MTTENEVVADRQAEQQAGQQAELRIVVGVDGSDCSKRALDYAAHEAIRAGAALQIVGVYNVPVEGSWVGPGMLHEDAITVVEESLGRVEEIEPDLVTKGEVTLGVPGPALADAARGALALVVGTRGHGHMAGIILGSVSEYVLHHATCTTTIVR